MKIAKTCILLFAAMTLLTALPCLAADETAFTGTEAACITCFCADCNPGTFKLLPNGGSQVRDMEGIYFYTASDPSQGGYLRVVLNWNFDASFSGPMWGSFYPCDESGNRIADGFEGMWNGQLFSLFPYNWINKTVGHGTGIYKGKKLESTTAYGNSFTGTVVGVIKDVDKE